MKMLATRRFFMSAAAVIPLLRGFGLWAVGLGSIVPGSVASQPAGQDREGRRVTLLYFTDTHAQLETHPEYDLL